MNPKKIIFSGVQPTGNLHLGNYLGALKQWVNLQKVYDCIFCVVDYHAITVRQNPTELQRQILDTAKIYLACGIDQKKSLIFRQSDINEHTELAWILNCTGARMSDLENMTQFKDKTAPAVALKEVKDITAGRYNASVGLFDYPVLMAADILLYNTDLVPVGHDQLQHIELTRDLAKRFNHDFGEVFVIPQAQLQTTGARIMGLDDPSKKMSKSAASPANYIALTDEPEVARKKIMRAVTDSGSDVIYDPENKPAISNLLTIYHLLSGIDLKTLVKKYQGHGYGDFKQDLAEVVAEFLTDFQTKLERFSDEEVEKIFARGAKKLKPIAGQTVKNVKEKLGLM